MAVSAGMVQYMVCSPKCFTEIHVAVAHPLEDCDFVIGSKKPYTFLTNIGIAFVCREDPKSFATVFGSIFHALTRSGKSLKAYVDPKSAEADRDSDLEECNEYLKLLSEYDEFKMFPIKLEITPVSDDESDSEEKESEHKEPPSVSAPPSTPQSRNITPPSTITGGWMGDLETHKQFKECKHIVSHGSHDIPSAPETAPVSRPERLQEPSPRSRSWSEGTKPSPDLKPPDLVKKLSL